MVARRDRARRIHPSTLSVSRARPLADVTDKSKSRNVTHHRSLIRLIRTAWIKEKGGKQESETENPANFL